VDEANSSQLGLFLVFIGNGEGTCAAAFSVLKKTGMGSDQYPNKQK